MNHYFAQLMENSFRIERMKRRTTLLAGLGPCPTPTRGRLFQRRVLSLAAEVVIEHPRTALRQQEATELEPQAA